MGAGCLMALLRSIPLRSALRRAAQRVNSRDRQIVQDGVVLEHALAVVANTDVGPAPRHHGLVWVRDVVVCSIGEMNTDRRERLALDGFDEFFSIHFGRMIPLEMSWVKPWSVRLAIAGA